MPRTKTPAPDPERAAKKAEDIAALEALGAAQCPVHEVVVIMGWDDRKRGFTRDEGKAYRKGRAEGLKALRQAQLAMANKSVAMATMLGRVYLGQTQQREQDEIAPIDYAGIAERVRDKIRLITASDETDTD